MPDPFAAHQPGLTSPAAHALAVTPSDALPLPQTCRAVYIGSSGNLAAVMASGESLGFTGLQGGMIYPLRLSQIRATGTTAGSIVALY